MNAKYIGLLVVASISGLALTAGVGCGDSSSTGGAGGTGTTATGTTSSTTTSSSKSTGTGTGTTTSSTGTGMMCSVSDPTGNCAEACAALYDCGALTCGTKNCAGFTGAAAEKTTFIGDANGGCIKTCTAQMALIALIDTKDCKQTVATLKGISTDFAMACDNGISGTTSSTGTGN